MTDPGKAVSNVRIEEAYTHRENAREKQSMFFVLRVALCHIDAVRPGCLKRILC